MRTTFALCVLVISFCGCTPSVENEEPSSAAHSVDAGASGTADLDNVGVAVDEPTSSKPAAFGIGVDKEAYAPGDTGLLVIHASIAEPWHIYAAEGSTGVGRPTKFEVSAPTGIELESDWILPAAEVKESSLGTVGSYHGEVRFGVRFTVTDQASPGTIDIPCKINFQACTDESCLPPSAIDVVAKLNVGG